MASNNHQDLLVWQKSLDIVDRVDDLTRSFLKDELYGLTNQIRRCVVSIPSNIAEGQGRNAPKDFQR
ncbi:MAG: four helix bundle protein [Anaerolineales bacterium]|nr:four helix bundle protein [Anaerolineales bacterium]